MNKGRREQAVDGSRHSANQKGVTALKYGEGKSNRASE